jgi:hypothetical protein
MSPFLERRTYPATDLTRPYPSQQEFATGRLLTQAGRRWYYDQYQRQVTRFPLCRGAATGG